MMDAKFNYQNDHKMAKRFKIIKGDIFSIPITNDETGFGQLVEGIIYLNSFNLGRLDLERILKKMDLPAFKKDNIQQLIDRMIENTIGFKLRSQAIQNSPQNAQGDEEKK